jgi:hypothetical protein
MAGLKTIIVLSFVLRHLGFDSSEKIADWKPLDPGHRLSSCHPLLRLMAQLPSFARRCDLYHRAIAKLDMRTMRKSR